MLLLSSKSRPGIFIPVDFFKDIARLEKSGSGTKLFYIAGKKYVIVTDSIESILKRVNNPFGVNSSYIKDPVQDVPELKSINTTNQSEWPDKIIILAENNGLYRFDRDSVTAGDDDIIVAPTTGVGRWFRMTDPTYMPYPTTLPPTGPAGGDLSGTYPNPIINSATETVAGKIEIADVEETTVGTDNTKAITPLKLQQKVNSIPIAYKTANSATNTTPNATNGGVPLLHGELILNLSVGLHTVIYQADISNSSTGGSAAIDLAVVDPTTTTTILKQWEGEPKDISNTLWPNWRIEGFNATVAGIYRFQLYFYNLGAGVTTITESQITLLKL